MYSNIRFFVVNNWSGVTNKLEQSEAIKHFKTSMRWMTIAGSVATTSFVFMILCQTFEIVFDWRKILPETPTPAYQTWAKGTMKPIHTRGRSWNEITKKKAKDFYKPSLFSSFGIGVTVNLEANNKACKQSKSKYPKGFLACSCSDCCFSVCCCCCWWDVSSSFVSGCFSAAWSGWGGAAGCLLNKRKWLRRRKDLCAFEQEICKGHSGSDVVILEKQAKWYAKKTESLFTRRSSILWFVFVCFFFVGHYVGFMNCVHWWLKLEDIGLGKWILFVGIFFFWYNFFELCWISNVVRLERMKKPSNTIGIKRLNNLIAVNVWTTCGSICSESLTAFLKTDKAWFWEVQLFFWERSGMFLRLKNLPDIKQLRGVQAFHFSVSG